VIEKGQEIIVKVKFIGSFHSLSGKGMLKLRLEGPCRVRDVIKTVIEELPKLEPALIDPESENPKTNLLIILNGQEISVLNLFETTVKDGDEVILVPIVHGG